jgi:hypothetical protein
MAITKSAVSELFMGQSDIVIFDKPSDYSTATLFNLPNPYSVGDVDNGSTSWTGDEPTVTPRKNEQGEAVTAKVEAGTLGYEFRLMSTDEETIKKFLTPGVAKAIASAAAAGAWDKVTKIIGFGNQTTVQTRPIMLVNDEADKQLVFPKAKLVASPTIEDGLFCIKVSVTAESIDTTNLDTAIMVFGSLSYEGETKE